MEFETLGSDIAKGIMKIIPLRFQEEEKFSSGPAAPKSGSHVHIKTHRLSDPLVFPHQQDPWSYDEFERLDENLEGFSQTWEEILLTLESDVGTFLWFHRSVRPDVMC